MNRYKDLREVFKLSLPVLCGYIPLGAAFGVLFSELGYHWLYATLMSLIVYAGAGQFLAVILLASGAGLAEAALSTFILNSRHMFYGLSLLDDYRVNRFDGLYKIFGLTDETYSLVTSAPVPSHKRGEFHLGMTALNHLYWITGCSLGAFIGSSLNLSVKGLDFVLTSLFVVLSLEQLLTQNARKLWLVSIGIGLFFLIFWKASLLPASLLTSVAVLFLCSRRS